MPIEEQGAGPDAWVLCYRSPNAESRWRRKSAPGGGTFWEDHEAVTARARDMENAGWIVRVEEVYVRPPSGTAAPPPIPEQVELDAIGRQAFGRLAAPDGEWWQEYERLIEVHANAVRMVAALRASYHSDKSARVAKATVAVMDARAKLDAHIHRGAAAQQREPEHD